MKRKDNSRRIDLINKKYSGSHLSADEEIELEGLQLQSAAELAVEMQPQIDYLDKIIKGLEKRVEDEL